MRVHKHTFNAHHSPRGAFASFTLGYPGAKGGLGLELAAPADQNVYIGLESRLGGYYEALPFFAGSEDDSRRYDVEKAKDADSLKGPALVPFAAASVVRDFTPCFDSWSAGDLTFTVISPVGPVPDPVTASDDEMRHALLPAVLAEMTIDNTSSPRPRRAFFGFAGTDPYAGMRMMDRAGDAPSRNPVGIASGLSVGIASSSAGVISAQGFSAESLLNTADPTVAKFALGGTALLYADAPAGQLSTYRFVICFYRGGMATSGLPTTYYYTKYYRDLEHVAAYALAAFDVYRDEAVTADQGLIGSALTDDQNFQLAHAVRSYYGSTQLLDRAGEPLWVVNEGEYRMMNTFDLTADQLFFEMRLNSWTVRNELETYLTRYSYRDTVRFPGATQEHPGGLSFTHDMGANNVFSCPNYSSYEMPYLDGCFSYMTHEQLTNWVLCAAVYAHGSGDAEWLVGRLGVLEECFESMLNRDHPVPALRDGVMSLDSSRCRGGSEITTYDSLDVSLGQSRNNIYLAVKCWAAYVALERIFAQRDRSALAAMASEQARRCAATLVAHVTVDGYIPAVIDEGNDSRIIPAIEGLVFPLFTGCPEAVAADGPYAALVSALKTHLTTVLVPGVCLFANGGWKLSSTSDNSWLSKIYLCQFVARAVLGLQWGEAGARADAAHVGWLNHPQKAYWSWSDQCLAGEPMGSRYYPRGVTSILWLSEAL